MNIYLQKKIRTSHAFTLVNVKDFGCIQRNLLTSLKMNVFPTIHTITTFRMPEEDLANEIQVGGLDRKSGRLIITITIICSLVGSPLLTGIIVFLKERCLKRRAKSRTFNKKIIGNWVKVSCSFSCEKMIQELLNDNFISKSTAQNIRRTSLNKQRDLILLEVVKNSTNIIEKFKSTKKFSLQSFVSSIMDLPVHKQVCFKVDLIEHKKVIEIHKDDLVRMLNTEEIVHEFLEKNIFNLCNFEEIIQCDSRTEMNKCFVEKLADNLSKGSYSCLEHILKRDERTTLLGILKMKSPLHDLVPSTVSQSSVVDLKLQHKKIYEANYKVTHAVMNVNVLELDVETETESERMYMKCTALLVQNLHLNPIQVQNNCLLLEALTSDVAFRFTRTDIAEVVKPYFCQSALPKGTYTAEVTFKHDQSRSSITDIKIEDESLKLNIIGTNKRFLSKEIDTTKMSKALTRLMINIPELKGDRLKKVEIICDVMEKNFNDFDKIETLLRLLKEDEMDYIYQRLNTCLKVFRFESDTRILKANILMHLTEIVSNLNDLNYMDEIKKELIDRHLMSVKESEKWFCEAELFESEIIKFIVEITKKGRNAILNFVDVLYTLKKDTLNTILHSILHGKDAAVEKDHTVEYEVTKDQMDGRLYWGQFQLRI